MRQYIIDKKDADQSLLKYLSRLMKEAPTGFFYKMLRKKNIILNGKKADGHEIIKAGDIVKIFISEDTFELFLTKKIPVDTITDDFALDIIYEDDNILLINKPAGILSQKALENDVSINEYCISYLVKSGEYNPDIDGAFRPSICNRLDRNTTGILIAAKTLSGAKAINEALRERTIHKYYVCPVKGIIDKPMHLTGSLDKDSALNKVTVYDDERGKKIETIINPIGNNGKYSLICVELKTGKSHQIRAHLASIGHPLLGDNKYGDRTLNNKLGLKYQLLHSYKLVMPQFDGELSYLSGKVFETEIPDIMNKLLGDTNGNLE